MLSDIYPPAQMVARLVQRALLPSLPLVDGSRRQSQENVEVAFSEAAETLGKGGSCRDVEAILLRAVGNCSSALLLPPCICLHVAAERRVRKHLCCFSAFCDFVQIFSARFRVMNPYENSISNVTLTLACSVLKVQRWRLLSRTERALFDALLAPDSLDQILSRSYAFSLTSLPHRLKLQQHVFVCWAAATPATSLSWHVWKLWPMCEQHEAAVLRLHTK
jgi:hypothetical protein